MIPLILHQCYSRVTWKYPFWTFAWYHIITCSKRNLNFLASLCNWVDWFGYTQRRLGYSRLRSFDVNSKTAFSFSDLIRVCRVTDPHPFGFVTRHGPIKPAQLQRPLYCQPRVTVTPWFVYKIIRSLVYQSYPQDRIYTQVIYRLALAQVVCKQNMSSLSLAGI